MKKKKTVTPVIMGIRPQGTKKLLALHFHPDAIRENVKGLVKCPQNKRNSNLSLRIFKSS